MYEDRELVREEKRRTTVAIWTTTIELLEKARQRRVESYDSIINRLIKFYLRRSNEESKRENHD